MSGRPLPIVLSRDDYRRLEAQARAEERDPIQQARWLLRRALREVPTSERDDPQRNREAVRA